MPNTTSVSSSGGTRLSPNQHHPNCWVAATSLARPHRSGEVWGGHPLPADGPSHDPALCFSGESGSGKTEATKLILSYLAAVSQKRSTAPQVGRVLPWGHPRVPMSPLSSPSSIPLFRPSLLTALLLSPCPNASTWTMADRGTEGTRGLGWVSGQRIVVAPWPWRTSCGGQAGGIAGDQCMHTDGIFVLFHSLI